MIHFDWSYISAVYVNEVYGQNAMRHISSYSKQAGICIAYTKELSVDSEDREYDETVRKLVENSKARVVVIFMFYGMTRKLHEAIIRANKVGYFIFFSTDSFRKSVYSGLEESCVGTFATSLKSGWIEDFESFYGGQSPWREDYNSPWFGFSTRRDCLQKYGPGVCENFTSNQDFPDFYFSSYYGPTADVALAFVTALHEYIQDNCLEFVGDREALRACYDGEKYLSYIRALDFKGFITGIKFDENGDILGGYDITYFRRYGEKYENRKVRVAYHTFYVYTYMKGIIIHIRYYN
jgi:hypothetical protein